jgi:hypothetical protein
MLGKTRHGWNSGSNKALRTMGSSWRSTGIALNRQTLLRRHVLSSVVMQQRLEDAFQSACVLILDQFN